MHCVQHQQQKQIACIGNFFPLPRRKKNNNPEVTMERLRYTLYQELRLALRDFSIAQETK